MENTMDIDLLNDVIPEWTGKHPVSNVLWVSADVVYANDYNPNKVAPPEMKLLKHSIETNGYTQPIVVWEVEDGYEVVDGFHRHQIGKELGYTHLPVVVINSKDTGRNDRIAATIRHNRARGKHQISAMSDIIVELSRRNWSDKRIGKELGMDPDEVLRLKQITGLAELFADGEFSEAWE
jgi:ParB-like chromosome segregation protein Spo0J